MVLEDHFDKQQDVLEGDQVVPELQRRGLFRKEYPGKTLRDTLGLSVPEKSAVG